MEKRHLYFIFLSTVCLGLCGCGREKMFIVRECCYVPLFGNSDSNLSYEEREHRTNCYNLMTPVLLWIFAISTKQYQKSYVIRTGRDLERMIHD